MAYEHQIPVSPTISTGNVYPQEIPTYTSMFRTDTLMQRVLDIGLASQPTWRSDDAFSVLSVGCSYGAEADSALAYVMNEAPEVGQLNVAGVDTNPSAVEAARQGRYQAVAPRISTPEGSAQLDLSEYLPVFDITPNPDGDVNSGFIIDTNRQRATHEVSFHEADLTETNIELPEANVILCNNLLYHLSAEKAERLVEAMAKQLAVGGVMSFGANAKQLRMNSNRGTANYIEWRHNMSEKLTAQNIVPVLYDRTRKAPFVFRREK